MRPGLTEHNFRRFESVISEAVTNYPCEVTLKPTSDLTSLSTLAARLRDALRAYEVHRYSTTFKPDQFDAVRPKLVVTSNTSSVLIAPRDASKTSDVIPATRGSAPTTALDVRTDNEDVLKALCVLHENNILAHPTAVTTPLNLDQIASFYDVGVNKTKDNEYIIL